MKREAPVNGFRVQIEAYLIYGRPCPEINVFSPHLLFSSISLRKLFSLVAEWPMVTPEVASVKAGIMFSSAARAGRRNQYQHGIEHSALNLLVSME